MKKLTYYLSVILLLFCSISCKKLVQVPGPINQLTSANVYKSNTTAASVMTGLYSNISGIASNKFSPFCGIICGLSADELKYYGTDVSLTQYYTNSLSTSIPTLYFWKEIYQNYIYTCNDILANLPNSQVSPAISGQLIGQAKFTRAFFNFYLTNLWGDIPLLTTTDYNVNGTISKASQAQVYQLIKQDLLDAQQSLNKNYLGADAVTTTTERTLPNYWAATALLARAYLYLGDWKNAEAQASAVIDNVTQYQLQTNLNSVFLANNQEAIWQLQPTTSNYDVNDPVYYILKGPPGTTGGNYTLSPFLLSAFEPGDKRRSNWVHDTTINAVAYSYAFKYKINMPTSSRAEYLTVLRLAEQYLIRAEAEAYGVGKGLSGAIADLNTIRNRAGLPAYSGAVDQASVLTAILHERQVELFTEFGHRWLDLKRTKTIDAVLGSPGGVTQAKGGSWSNYKALFPIPLTDIQYDHNLIQNGGY